MNNIVGESKWPKPMILLIGNRKETSAFNKTILEENGYEVKIVGGFGEAMPVIHHLTRPALAFVYQKSEGTRNGLEILNLLHKSFPRYLLVPFFVQDNASSKTRIQAFDKGAFVVELSMPDQELLALVRGLAQYQVNAIESGMRDQLTGLLNYGAFRYVVKNQIGSTFRKPESSISLILIDIDNFKMINDKEGYVFANRVLVELANHLKSGDLVRPSDYICRYGGDEFAILLVDVNKKSAQNIGKRLQEALHQIQVSEESGHTITLRISFGVGSLSGKGIKNLDRGFERLVKMADKELKKSRANRYQEVVVRGVR